MYQALYRKYRPQTFSDVVGQKSVTDTLRAQLETGRLSHAYLFTGTRGTGKTSCAKILAKAVNCENPNHGDPCGVCPSCRAIDEGSCMDVLEIDAASNNGVDSVRVLRDDAIYTPGTVKMRVYIIDEVHMLSTAAFNALLKIIEEPPAHLLFILATTELQKVPATILSRCQRFAFKRLRAEEIASRLNFIAYQEHIEIEPDAVNLLARLADGGMRDGVSLLDQCASAAGGAVTLESVYASLGLAGERRTAELMQAIAQQDTAKALTVFSSLYAAGKDVGALLGEMCALCRDLLVLHTAPKSGLAMLSGIATEQQALALQDMFSPGELMRVLTETQKTRASFGKNTDVRVAAELLLMQLCEPALRLDAQALNARISRVEEQLASGVLVQARPAAAPRGAESFVDRRFQLDPSGKRAHVILVFAAETLHKLLRRVGIFHRAAVKIFPEWASIDARHHIPLLLLVAGEKLLQKIVRRISNQNVADVEHHRVHAVPRHGFVFKIESDSVFHFLRSFLLADEWAAQRLQPSSLTKSVHFTV